MKSNSKKPDKVNKQRKHSSHPPRIPINALQYLYGILPVQQALVHQQRSLSHLYLKKNHGSERLENLHQLAQEKNIPISLVERRELDDLCPTVPHQGCVLACGSLPYADINLLEDTSTPQLFLALDQINDPHNLGAIIRSCAFFNVSGIIVPRQNCPELTPTVSKTSAGVAEYFPVIAIGNMTRFFKEQKKKGYWIVGLDAEGSNDLSNYSLDQSYILVLGNEGRGLRPLVKSTCDWLVKIPGNAEVASLNVSNAAAIALYQFSQIPPS